MNDNLQAEKLKALQKEIDAMEVKYPCFEENPTSFKSPLHEIIYNQLQKLYQQKEALEIDWEKGCVAWYDIISRISALEEVVGMANYKEANP